MELTENDKIIKPRCPSCGRVVAEWLRGEAGYTCPRCHVKFAIDTINGRDLTEVLKRATTILT